MIKEITAILGEPGCGKTFQLSQKVNKILEKDQSVYIMNPTKSARNNVRKAFKKLLDSGDMTFDNYKKAVQSTNVLHGYNGEQNIFIDEAAMIGLTDFYAILYATIDIPDVRITLLGDLRQIEPVYGDSILKTLIESSIAKNDDRDIWEFVADTLYSQLVDITVPAPNSWKLDTLVDIIILRKNYRLQSKDFNGYDSLYYDDLINHAIEDDNESYKEYLQYAIEHYYLITTPTIARGNEINVLLTQCYKDAFDIAPFITMNNEYYLNPYHKHYDELQNHFDFMPEISIEDINSDIIPTAYMSTHRVQSFTVDNVLFYMGNTPIGSRHKSHYSNNLLYTAVTRSRHDVILLGLKSSFEQMRVTMPQTSQEKNVHLRAKVAIHKLRKWIEEQDKPNAEEIWDTYMKLYGDDSILNEHDKAILDTYSIKSEPHNKRYVINYINDKYKKKFGFSLTNWLENNKKEVRKQRRNGKIKQWLDDLSNNEFDQVESDLRDRKFKNDYFKNKYGFTKEQVRKSIK